MHLSTQKSQYCDEVQEGLLGRRTVQYRRFRLSVKVLLNDIEKKAAEKYGWADTQMFIQTSELHKHSDLEEVEKSSGHVKSLRFKHLLEGVWFTSGNVAALLGIEKDVKELASTVYGYLLVKVSFGGEEILPFGEEEAVQAALHAAIGSDN